MENRFGLPGINTDNPRPLNEGDKSHSFQCYTNSPLRGFPGTKSYSILIETLNFRYSAISIKYGAWITETNSDQKYN